MRPLSALLRDDLAVSGSQAIEPDRSVLEPHWYAVRTRSRHEKKVRDELLGRGTEAFLPLYERWSRWKDRETKVQFPLFPGYCFARFPSTERLRVLTIYGVAGIVGVNGQPEAVPEREIASIQQLVQSRFDYDPHPFFAEGMEVEVTRGPLRGVHGRLLRKDRSTQLVLAVGLIRQAVVVTVHPADVVRL